MRCGACLAHSVPLLDRTLDASVHGFHEFLCQRRGARIQHSYGTEIIIIDDGMFAEKEHHRRNDVSKSNPAMFNSGTEFLDIEFGHDDQGNAVENGIMDKARKT